MHGASFDEVAHLTAGTSYVAYQDFRFQPENGLLPQAWAGLPVALSGHFPPDVGRAWAGADVWGAGRELLGGPAGPSLLARGRGMIVLFLLATLTLVWRLSRRLFGPVGGLLSLALGALSPTMLAHGAVVTSDVCAAGFFLGATWVCWQLAREVSVKRVLGAGAAVTGLLLSKASGVLIAPIALVLVGVRLARGDADRPGRLVAAALLVALLAWGGLWAAYGFRYSTFAPDHSAEPPSHLMPLPGLLEDAGAVEGPLRLAFEHRLLPEAWLYGFAHVMANSAGRSASLRGEYRTTGWWWFFPYAFGIKTPLTLLALLALGIVGARAAPPGERAPWFTLLGVYGAATLSTNLNIGHRHLLPMLPPLFVLAGGLGTLLRGRGRVAIPALFAALLIEVVASWPHYLSYMNPLAGPDRWRHLVDSSLDWGQEGPLLAKELARLRGPDEPVHLAWFGSMDPRSYGIEAEALPSFLPWAPPGAPLPLRPGLYAVSATQLQGVYTGSPPPWTPDDEAAYQRALRDWRLWIGSGDDARARLLAARPLEDWVRTLRAFDRLRFERLSTWLRREGRPVGRAGHAVLIYRLSGEDLTAALGGPAPLP